MDTKQLQLQIQQVGTITGFNYAFAKLLLNHLKKLLENPEDMSPEPWPKNPEEVGCLTFETASVITKLAEQTMPNGILEINEGEWIAFNEIKRLAEGAEAFLGIFELKQ